MFGFIKVFDFVGRESIDKIIWEFSVKFKLANIICETLTDTVSKRIFVGEIRQPHNYNKYRCKTDWWLISNSLQLCPEEGSQNLVSKLKGV